MAIIGLKLIDQLPVLLFVTKAQQVLMMGSSRIFEIKEVGFVAVRRQLEQEAALAAITDKLN